MHDALTHREDGRVSDQPLHRGRRPASVAGLVLRAVGEPLVVEGPAPVPRGLARGLDRSHLAQDRGDRVLVEDRREQHEAVLSEVALLVGGAHADERLAVQRLAHGWLVGERLGTCVCGPPVRFASWRRWISAPLDIAGYRAEGAYAVRGGSAPCTYTTSAESAGWSRSIRQTSAAEQIYIIRNHQVYVQYSVPPLIDYRVRAGAGCAIDRPIFAERDPGKRKTPYTLLNCP